MITRVFADFCEKILIAAELKKPPEREKPTNLPVYISFDLDGQHWVGWYESKNEAIQQIQARIAELDVLDEKESPERLACECALDRLDVKNV